MKNNSDKQELDKAMRGVKSYFKDSEKPHALAFIKACTGDWQAQQTLDKLNSAGYGDTAAKLSGINVYCDRIHKLTSQDPTLKEYVDSTLSHEARSGGYSTLYEKPPLVSTVFEDHS
jgi:hypothetical protein